MPKTFDDRLGRLALGWRSRHFLNCLVLIITHQRRSATAILPQFDMAGGQKNARVFGQAVRTKSGKGRGGGGGAATRYQRQMGQGRNLPKNLTATNVSGATEEEELAARRAEARRRRKAEGEAFDARFGYGRYDKRALTAASVSAAGGKMQAAGAGKKEQAAATSPGGSRRGWIFNMLPTVSSIESRASFLLGRG